MSESLDTLFCRELLKQVLLDVRKFEPKIRVNDAQTYIERRHTRTGNRWFTFKFRDFYWEDYVDNIYDGKAQAWNIWLDRQQRQEPQL